MKTSSLILLSMLAAITGAATSAAQPAPAPPPAGMVAPVPPAKPQPMPVKAPPADDLIKYGAAMAGVWHCKGNAMEPDGSSHPMNGTDKVTVELDKFWIHNSYSAPQGKWTFRFEAYTTYDAATKLWKRVMLTNDGGVMQGTAKPDPAKVDWDMTMDAPSGNGMFRDHSDLSDLKTGLKTWGEVSMDKGKTWMKVYEQTCKK